MKKAAPRCSKIKLFKTSDKEKILKAAGVRSHSIYKATQIRINRYLPGGNASQKTVSNIFKVQTEVYSQLYRLWVKCKLVGSGTKSHPQGLAPCQQERKSADSPKL